MIFQEAINDRMNSLKVREFQEFPKYVRADGQERLVHSAKEERAALREWGGSVEEEAKPLGDHGAVEEEHPIPFVKQTAAPPTFDGRQPEHDMRAADVEAQSIHDEASEAPANLLSEPKRRGRPPKSRPEIEG